MKKTIMAIAVLLMLCSQVSYASTGLDSPISIVPSFLVWANLYGVPDMNDQITTGGEDEKGQNAMYVDCLCVNYDNATFETRDVIMYYCTTDKTDPLTKTYQDMRVLALISAIETGKPSGESYKVIEAERKTSIEIKEKLDLAIRQYKELIDAGEFVPFHVSKKGTYYITGRTDGGITSYFVFVA